MDKLRRLWNALLVWLKIRPVETTYHTMDDDEGVV